MVEKVRKYIEQYQMIQKGETIVLGISGGADSVCLLFVLLELQPIYDLKLVGVHVNHNLRGEDARADQQYVEALCREYGVPCTVIDVDVQAEASRRKRSLEEAGREVRKEAFEQMRKMLQEEEVHQGRSSCGQIRIATAHHSNDNAETFLMNLARGTGIVGLTGIAPISNNYIRPLLCVSREEIESYLSKREQVYCTDSTNAENIYTRNIIRNEIMPRFENGINQQTVSHMNQTIEELQKIEGYLQMQLQVCWEACIRWNTDKTSLIICKEGLRKQPEILRERLVKRAIEEMAEARRDITRAHITQLLELQDKQVGRETHLPYQLIGKRVYEGVEIQSLKFHESQNNLMEEGMKLQIPGKTYLENGSVITTQIFPVNEMEGIQDNPYTQYFDYDIITEALYIRSRNLGDYITINELGNRQTLKKFFTTNKIPQTLRGEVPVVAINQEVLWIIGHRRSSNYQIEKNTKRILAIQYDGGNHGRNS